MLFFSVESAVKLANVVAFIANPSFHFLGETNGLLNGGLDDGRALWNLIDRVTSSAPPKLGPKVPNSPVNVALCLRHLADYDERIVTVTSEGIFFLSYVVAFRSICEMVV